MRRIFTLMMCVAIAAGVNAQWLLYDASKLPSETGGDELDLTSLSQDEPGPNFVEAIMDDPDIPGNSILQYIQPDEMNIAGDGNATKMYRSFFPDGWLEGAFTMVARVRGVPNWEELGLDRVFDLQYRNGLNDMRDELRIFYDGDIELEKSDTTVNFTGDVTDWHIFRVAVDGKTSTVYIDEDDTPFTAGEATDGTGDQYIKIGDGSGDKIGGYVDWVAMDYSGAYSPSQKPLDGRFTGVDNNRGSVAFITKDVDEYGNLEEIEIISELRKRGYLVDVTYPDPADITIPPDIDFSYDAMNQYDVVIIGRGVSSGDFQDETAVDGWESVTSPVIIFSSYLMRSSRLKLANTGTARRENDDGPSVPRDRVTNARIVDHPVFTGVDEDMDGEIGYLTWFYDYLGMAADTFEATHNGTLLGTYVDPGGPGDGTVCLAYWEAGTETYDGSGVTPAGDRMYFQMGSDDNNSPKVRNYTAFTEESLIVLYNSLDWLSGRDPEGVLPEAGPIAYWNFNEGTGTMVVDAIGNANGEVLNGNGMTWESCGVGGTLSWAGSTKPEAIVQVPHHPNLGFDSTQSFSISMLVWADPFSNVAEMTLFMKGDNGSALPAGMGHWYSVATKDNQLRFAVDDDVVKTQLDVDITEDMFPTDQWNHVMAVRDLDEDSLKLYLNGELVGSIKDDTDLDISTDSLPVVMGNYHSGVRKLNGSLDEVMVYDFAFTAQQVADLFASVSPTTECEVLETISELSNDATLASLDVSAGTLDPAFDPEVTTYKLTLPQGATSVDITATPNDPNATVEGDGTIDDVPGTANIIVTAQDGSTREYIINIAVEGIGPARIIVEPGFGTLETAIIEANDGDTLVLRNGETYSPFNASYGITKKLVIIAEEIPALPGLENQPLIENIFTLNPLFDLQSGADLHLIGIEIDAQGVANMFNVQGAAGESRSLAIYVNRCRLHNTTDDLFNDARDGNTDNTVLTSCVVRNSFVYNTGAGHGFYVKNYLGSNDTYVFENITYWNVGQQFNWIRHYDGDDAQTFVYDHLTGYNMSSDEGQNKELFGNSDGTGEAALTIDFKNSILHTQLSTDEGSLKFNNTSGRHSITINNNVLFQVQPIVDIGGTINKSNNQEGVDPMFVDPDNGDFTVMNADLYDAADDGEIVGAIYWHPDFVDDFSDIISSAADILRQKFELNAYPNPFSDEVTVNFKLENPSRVELHIYDINGRLIDVPLNENRYTGEHKVQVNTSGLKPGIYIYQLRTNGQLISSKMIKAQ